MILKVQDIIVDAIALCGATQMDQVPPAWEMNRALRFLNKMINAWATQRLLVRGTFPESKALTAGDGEYTIGVDGDFDTIKPFKITSAFVRDSDGNDYEMEIIPVSEYNLISDKTQTGRPQQIAFDSGQVQKATGSTLADTNDNTWDNTLNSSWTNSLVSLGKLYIYPTPDSTTTWTLHINSHKPLVEFSDIGDEVTFEPQYEEALTYNLAIRLWRTYRKVTDLIPPDITRIAADGLGFIKAANSVQSKMRCDVPGRGGAYNINTDE